ncbi:beta-lactamase-like protein [Cokeromyces recurvatus]|uniref:beta-lactamase-like protein n=1 Tax=Cokeromyces recurvatus TaxID=90255 RepID=UPI00221FA140|nr:beta-lactamase-like protein [Cokeromyces recurvatus]KAI7901673.1 beta-lactamase-like protein [Cokeromyces recurvatus]
MVAHSFILSLPPAPSEKSYKLAIRANDFFERELFDDAIIEYTKILRLSEDSYQDDDKEYFALIYSNRSACYIKTGEYERAKQDAIKVINLTHLWSKGYFRYGEALLNLSFYDEAIEAFKKAIHKEQDMKNAKEISHFVARAFIEKDNFLMGIKIIQLMPGRDVAIKKKVMNPIQIKLYDLAAHMKNIIHIIVDLDSKKCIVIDPCWDIDSIIKFVNEQGYIIVAIIVTHHHFDHIGGSPPAPYDTLPIKISGLSTLLKRIPYIKAYIHPLEIPFIKDIPSNRLVPTTTTDITNTLTIGKIHVEFLHTPGHTPGSQSLLINKSRLIAGDTLLCHGHCGRTDLPGGSRKAMKNTLRHILGNLDDRIIIYPGHNYGTTWSTIGIERDNGCLGDELVGFGMLV